ncbi:MAG: adenylyl-sulfate kinase [Rhodospirillales bacterium]|nr:adenylyl-sulfate kinase [Rhodospirillales bacterium]
MPRNQSSRTAQPPLKLVVVGHVNSGKSALIGRLLHDTGSPPPGKRQEGEAIEVSRIRFMTGSRDCTVIDAPSPREFLRTMVSGEDCADAAILIVDAAEGVSEDSRRHAYLLHLLGIRQVAVVINKMDLVAFGQDRFAEVAGDMSRHLSEIGITPALAVPVSARDGDNIARRSKNMAWYGGPSVLEALERFESVTLSMDQPLRLPIQQVGELEGRRLLTGRIETGVLRVGDTILLSPSIKNAHVHSIKVSSANDPVAVARAGESVGIVLDEKIYVEPGEMASHKENPPQLTTVFPASLVWNGAEPLGAGKTYTLQLATQKARVAVQSIERVYDMDTLAECAGGRVECNTFAEVILRGRQILAVDEFRAIARTGRFALFDGDQRVAGGLISMQGYPDQRQALTIKSTNITSVEHRVTAESRLQRNGHGGGVLWLTGLSGAGKSTLAMAVEQHLFRKGFHVYVLDGDNVRRGLNANLGFSPMDRAENIRRIGEVAALFADSGIICVSAFISPYQSDRDRARAAAGDDFHEIYIKADLETCEQRDPKGLYRKARAGEIQDFTGISAPYEEPVAPELCVDTASHTIDECVQQIVDYVNRVFALKPTAGDRDD